MQDSDSVLEAIEALREDLVSTPLPRRPRRKRKQFSCPAAPVPQEWWRNPLFYVGIVAGVCLSRLWTFLTGLERAVSTCLELTRPRHRDGIRGEPLRLA